jgi:hypothetical protein
MKRFSEYLVETTLSRVWGHMNDPITAVGIISASRHTNTPEENGRATRQLAGRVQNAGYGFFYVDGKFVEDGNRPVVETSIFIVGTNDNGRLKSLLLHWCKEFDQEAAIYKPTDSTEAFMLYRDGTQQSLGTLHPDNVSQYMTTLRGRGERNFTFDSFDGAWSSNGMAERWSLLAAPHHCDLPVIVRINETTEVHGTIVGVIASDIEVMYERNSKARHVPYFAMQPNYRYVLEGKITERAWTVAEELIRELWAAT